MATQGTWSRAKYGPRHEHNFWHETSVSGSNLPWIVYFPGGGWSRNSPDAWYDDSVGEPMWANGSGNIWSSIGTYPVRGFIANYGRAYYDFVISGTPNSPDDAYVGDYPTTPGFRGAGIRDGQRLIQYLKDHATTYGINPRAGIVMGASAGGQVAGGVAYSPSRTYYGLAHPSGSTNYIPRSTSRVAACHLRITPTFWSDYSIGGTSHGRALFGDETQALWDGIHATTKDSLGPGGIALAHKLLVPTAFYSNETLSSTAAQDPPFGGQTESVWSGASVSYSVGDRVTNAGGSDDAYYCIQAHTSGVGGDEPGVGGSWETYWEAYQHDPYHDPINGKLLLDRVFTPQNGEFIFGHPGSGHTYPDDIYDWMVQKWDAALS